MFEVSNLLYTILLAILTYLPILGSIAFIILAERRVLAAIQRREGPNTVGFFGLLQSFIDGFKLVLKENMFPYKSNKFIFLGSSFLILVFSLCGWLIIPISVNSFVVDFKYSVFLIFILSTINVYCVIFAGWSSNSKYALLGALRSAAQMISYEVYFGLLLIPIFIYSESLNLINIVEMQKNM
jgi:NADH:ubiquinone oxidoreductase subunit H